MRTQMEKAEAFRALHARPGAFIIPNPWDGGTARLLAAMGFEALATTSLGLANMLGSVTVSLDAIIENCRAIADATDLPVNADLENGVADDPKTAANAITRAAEAGCVGGSIEDFDRRPAKADLRFRARGRARAGRGRSGAHAALPVHADRAGGKPPAWPQRHRRHDQAPAGLRGRGGRRAVFARRARHRHHQHRGVVGRQALQPGDGLCRPDTHAAATIRSRRQTHQRRRRHGALRPRRIPEMRPRNEGPGRLYLRARMAPIGDIRTAFR